MASNKVRGSSFSFMKRPTLRSQKQNNQGETLLVDTLRAEFRGNQYDQKNSYNKGSTGRFTNSTENLADLSIDEDGNTIQLPALTFLGNILKVIDKSEFQELVDQIPDEKPLSRDEMNFLNGK